MGSNPHTLSLGILDNRSDRVIVFMVVLVRGNSGIVRLITVIGYYILRKELYMATINKSIVVGLVVAMVVRW